MLKSGVLRALPENSRALRLVSELPDLRAESANHHFFGGAEKSGPVRNPSPTNTKEHRKGALLCWVVTRF